MPRSRYRDHTVLTTKARTWRSGLSASRNSSSGTARSGLLPMSFIPSARVEGSSDSQKRYTASAVSVFGSTR